MEEKEKIKTKIDSFLKNNIRTHIRKTNRMFLNGTFIKKVSEDFYLFKEDKLGELKVYLPDIYDLDVCFEKGGPHE